MLMGILQTPHRFRTSDRWGHRRHIHGLEDTPSRNRCAQVGLSAKKGVAFLQIVNCTHGHLVSKS